MATMMATTGNGICMTQRGNLPTARSLPLAQWPRAYWTAGALEALTRNSLRASDTSIACCNVWIHESRSTAFSAYISNVVSFLSVGLRDKLKPLLAWSQQGSGGGVRVWVGARAGAWKTRFDTALNQQRLTCLFLCGCIGLSSVATW